MLNKDELNERLGTTTNTADSPARKLNDFINYLADNYSENENGGISLEEAVFIARKNIGESVINKREERGLSAQDGDLLCNDKVYGSKGNWTVGFFIKHPRDAVQYLLVQSKQQALKNGDTNRAAKFNAVAEKINGKRHTYDTYSFFNGSRANDMINIEKQFIGGATAVEHAFNANKAGFWERFLRRTSKEYKNFEKEFEAYRKDTQRIDGMDSRSPNRAATERSARAYLQHKIPGYDGKDLPTLESINNLKGKSKSRAMLCYNVLKATKESAEFENKDRALVETVEREMAANGTDLAINKLYAENSIDAGTIKGVLNDFTPIETVTSIDGGTKVTEFTDKQKDFQKSLARDLDDKPNGVDVKKLWDNVNEIEVDHDINTSMDMN